MKISDKIAQLEKLEDEIEEFFSRITNYYLKNSPHWSSSVNRSSYRYSSWDNGTKKGFIRIGVSNGHGDYENFEISSKILHDEDCDWKKYADQIISAEVAELEEKSAIAKAEREKQERELLAKLKEKYQ